MLQVIVFVLYDLTESGTHYDWVSRSIVPVPSLLHSTHRHRGHDSP